LWSDHIGGGWVEDFGWVDYGRGIADGAAAFAVSAAEGHRGIFLNEVEILHKFYGTTASQLRRAIAMDAAHKRGHKAMRSTRRYAQDQEHEWRDALAAAIREVPDADLRHRLEDCLDEHHEMTQGEDRRRAHDRALLPFGSSSLNSSVAQHQRRVYALDAGGDRAPKGRRLEDFFPDAGRIKIDPYL
jgi:hypothetical protein